MDKLHIAAMYHTLLHHYRNVLKALRKPTTVILGKLQRDTKFFCLPDWWLVTSIHPECPATGLLDTGYLNFSVCKQTLRWFESSQLLLHASHACYTRCPGIDLTATWIKTTGKIMRNVCICCITDVFAILWTQLSSDGRGQKLSRRWREIGLQQLKLKWK